MKINLFTYLLICSTAANAQSPFVFKKIDGFQQPRQIQTTNKLLFFTSYDTAHHICASEGSTATTTAIITPNGQPVLLQAMDISSTTLVSFFIANSNIASLWQTNGTKAGTQKIADLGINDAVTYNSKIYFSGIDNNTKNDLWATDGTVAGTVMIKDFNIAPTTAYMYNMHIHNGKLFFTITGLGTGAELWISDGTTAGTLQVGINTQSGNPPKHINSLTSFGNNLLFALEDDTYGAELWISDGTTAGTQRLTDINPGIGSSIQSGLTVMNGYIYFTAYSTATGVELWKTDGTIAGTKMVKDIDPSNNGGVIGIFAVLDNHLYFSADDNLHGQELWRTDGTDAGTVMVSDIVAGTDDSNPSDFISYNGNLYFGAEYAGKGTQLYVAMKDNSVKPLYPASLVNSPLLGFYKFKPFIKDDYVYFAARYSTGTDSLWAVKDTTGAASVAATDKAVDLLIYPNPANHNFTIKTSTPFKTGSVTLTDATGSVVKTEILYNNEQTISLQGIAPGMYMADIWLDDKRSTQKLIVQ
ncbi:MAG: ELWxxDGT repeat protein [Flavipsychrobacter sp.]